MSACCVGRRTQNRQHRRVQVTLQGATGHARAVREDPRRWQHAVRIALPDFIDAAPCARRSTTGPPIGGPTGDALLPLCVSRVAPPWRKSSTQISERPSSRLTPATREPSGDSTASRRFRISSPGSPCSPAVVSQTRPPAAVEAAGCAATAHAIDPLCATATCGYPCAVPMPSRIDRGAPVSSIRAASNVTAASSEPRPKTTVSRQGLPPLWRSRQVDASSQPPRSIADRTRTRRLCQAHRCSDARR